MNDSSVLNLGVVGCGHIATQQVAAWEQAGKVRVVAGFEPNAEQFAKFDASLSSSPAAAQSLESLLEDHGNALDAVYIATPHVFHAGQAQLALHAGLDVLLEKPMAFSISDACAIEKAAEEGGGNLVVAFNGSLSPKLRAASEALASGEFGKIHSISAAVSENWAGLYQDHWKQNPEISGGGFLLDSGSHALNAIIDLAGCGIENVSARFQETKSKVEITASVSGKLRSGALFSLSACGDTAPPCLGEITVFCEKAVLRVDPWGKRAATVRRNAEDGEEEIPFGETRELIDLFMDVRDGHIENPSPISRNVEFARLWAATRASADLDGRPVYVDEMEY